MMNTVFGEFNHNRKNGFEHSDQVHQLCSLVSLNFFSSVIDIERGLRIGVSKSLIGITILMLPFFVKNRLNLTDS